MPPRSPPSELPLNRNTIGGSLMAQGGDRHKKEMVVQLNPCEGDSSFLRNHNGVYDKPLSCFGCGIGWFSFIVGFAFPPLWYYATVLYFRNYYLEDLRERPGLAASAIAALISSVIMLISLLAVLLC